MIALAQILRVPRPLTILSPACSNRRTEFLTTFDAQPRTPTWLSASRHHPTRVNRDLRQTTRDATTVGGGSEFNIGSFNA